MRAIRGFCAAALLALLLAPASASAGKHSIAIGFADPDFHRGPDERSFLMDEAQ